jgi:quinol monooxygenase YgiN
MRCGLGLSFWDCGCITANAEPNLDPTGTTVLIYEQYRNEAALDHHRNTPHFAEHGIGGLYQRMRKRTLENLNAVEP